jgi:Spy/CpxP family protein refolding chaperone
MRLGAIAATLGFLTTALAGAAVGQSGHGHQQTPGHQHGEGRHQGHAQPHGERRDHHDAHGHDHGAGAAPHRRVEAYQQEFDQVVAGGRGFGLAFAADQNGYPGPLHVLEAKDRLDLTPAQEARVTALYDAMLAEARARAAALAAAEARLRRLFAAGAADAPAVRAAVGAAEAARAEVRLVHLLAHVETRDVLTETQRRAYHELRWGAAKNR